MSYGALGSLSCERFARVSDIYLLQGREEDYSYKSKTAPK